MSKSEAGVLRLTAVIRKEDGQYFSVCPELSIASQGDTVEEAKAMLKEALEGWFECVGPEEYDHLFDEDSVVFPLRVSGLATRLRVQQLSAAGHAPQVPHVTVG